MAQIPDEDCGLPWPERLLSAVVDTPSGAVEIHTSYVPPGSSNGWLKVETFEGIFRRLARPSALPRILCGDFNSPQVERADGRVVTWGESVADDGTITVDRERDGRWDQAERSVLCGLAEHDLADVFRQLHGYGVQDASWFFTRHGKTTGRRFDHVFASRRLNAVACEYLQPVSRRWSKRPFGH
jgi:exonuclease III